MANGNLNLGQQLSPSGQTRTELARSLLGQGASGAPVQSVTQGLNRLAQGLLGGRLANMQRQEERENQQALAQTLQRVTRAGQQGVVTGPGGGGTGEVATPDQRIIDALSSNPQTAPMAAQLTLEQALKGPEAQTQTVPGTLANQFLGVNRFGADDAVTIERTPQGGTVVTDVFESEAPTGESVNVRVPGRERPVLGVEDEQGLVYVFNDQGERVRAPRGSTVEGIRGTAEEAGIGDTELRHFRDLEAKLPVVGRLQTRIREGLESDEFVGGISGSTIQVFNSLSSQVDQLRSAFNEDRPEDEKDVALFPGQFQDELGGVTNMSNQVQSGILDLAYMTLKAKGERRVSDQDIRLELRSFGLDTNDPNVIMNRVNDKIGDLFANYRTRANQLGREPTFEFQPQQLGGEGGGDIPPIPDAARNEGVTPALWKAMTPEERSLFTENQ